MLFVCFAYFKMKLHIDIDSVQMQAFIVYILNHFSTMAWRHLTAGIWENCLINNYSSFNFKAVFTQCTDSYYSLITTFLYTVQIYTSLYRQIDIAPYSPFIGDSIYLTGRNMWIQVRSMDGRKSIRLDNLSKLSKIDEIRELVAEDFEAEPERQRLFYRGKQV